jgi:hypothetical protein
MNNHGLQDKKIQKEKKKKKEEEEDHFEFFIK